MPVSHASVATIYASSLPRQQVPFIPLKKLVTRSLPGYHAGNCQLFPRFTAMKIELNDQQEQAVKQGLPVEVVDVSSERTFVVVSRDLYERLCSLHDGGPGQGLPPGASPAVASPSGGESLRQRIRDLPLPSAMAAEAKRYCAYLGLGGAKCRVQMEEQMKLQHYYGGRWIAYLRTAEGPVVIAAADSLDDPSFDQQLAFLTAEERRRAVIDSPTPLFDEESEILTPFPDEG